MERISSNWRLGDNWRISYRYYLDGNELWFNYGDICAILHIDSGDFSRKYFKQIHNYNKRIFEDTNNSSNRPEDTKFINKAAFDEFVAHEIERANVLSNDMDSLAADLGLIDSNSCYECKHLIGNITTELNKKEYDRDKVREYTSKLFMTPELQSIINNKYYDKEIQTYKQWLESEEDMFVAYKENDEVHIYTGPTLDEAVDVLFKAGLEE